MSTSNKRIWVRVAVVACSLALVGVYVGCRAMGPAEKKETAATTAPVTTTVEPVLDTAPVVEEKPAERRRMMGGSKSLVLTTPEDFESKDKSKPAPQQAPAPKK